MRQALQVLRTADTGVEQATLVLFDDASLELANRVAAESEAD